MRKSKLASFMADEHNTAKLAHSVGCSVQHLRNIRDRRKSPSLRLAMSIAKAIDLSDINELAEFLSMEAE
jgi:DNA-binding XRE family transcriptional regulator